MVFLLILLVYFLILPVAGALLTFIISKIRKSKHIKRNIVFAFVFIFNSQFFYMLTHEEVESWFGLYGDSWAEQYHVSTPYGNFSTDDTWSTYGSYNIKSVAEYDHYIIMEADSSYILIDRQDKEIKVIEVPSLSDLPMNVTKKNFVGAPDYIRNLFWRIHDDNHLYVIKILLALAISSLVTIIEYLLFKKIKTSIIRERERKERRMRKKQRVVI